VRSFGLRVAVLNLFFVFSQQNTATFFQVSYQSFLWTVSVEVKKEPTVVEGKQSIVLRELERSKQ